MQGPPLPLSSPKSTVILLSSPPLHWLLAALGLQVLLLAAVAGPWPWAGPWPRRRVLRWGLLGALWLGAWAAEAQRQEVLAVYDPDLET